jgi:hypothetical protein
MNGPVQTASTLERNRYPELDPALPGSASGVRRHRRRLHSDNLRTRRKHIRAAYLRLVEDVPLRAVAGRFRCTERTIQNWATAALGYPDPEAVALRRLVAGAPSAN